jgi:DhnA family fructose-bisphosphate aldolase class Ia
VIQHPDPPAMLRALSALVHENSTAEQAHTLLTH